MDYVQITDRVGPPILRCGLMDRNFSKKTPTILAGAAGVQGLFVLANVKTHCTPVQRNRRRCDRNFSALRALLQIIGNPTRRRNLKERRKTESFFHVFPHATVSAFYSL
jgi:hypothetical protein